ncbi:MAG TPA: hypothetical protein GX514_03235 [Thermoanaerobacterales bacterium]|uniref:hypothetical protein n=1 Tax=Tepidanaerobacter sp. GT38 TaxID=2722793 RepID=UPI00184EBE74|nr:hypothetical protein [Tepidanaerobacter sp. GT38]MCG1012800.1 hypothetical protein [Tepidanaerobacter sp. GT38]HHY41846.1 hypothetical protein [Thermoanaerobacterales bacterium]
MTSDKKSVFNKIDVSADEIKKQYGVDLYLFLDAVSLGLNDAEIADLTGYDLDKVIQVRKRLGNVTSEIGINYKKNLPKPDRS